MMSRLRRWFAALPTPSKLLLILTAAILPVGIGLVIFATDEIREADDALRGRAEDQSRAAVSEIESLIARNALALRIAANAALADGTDGSCERAQRSLNIAPGVARNFELESIDGAPLCEVGGIGPTGALPAVAPGAILLQVSPDDQAIVVRVGVNEGMATGAIPLQEISEIVRSGTANVDRLMLGDGTRQLTIVESGPQSGSSKRVSLIEHRIANGQLLARSSALVPKVATLDRLLLLMPLLMWILAALVTWLLVSSLLIRPLRQLSRAVAAYVPGEQFQVPSKLGPAMEIRELRDAFRRAFTRVEESEHHMSEALDGQRRLVREVHHRVKNNLQVVASLLNIHSRSARTDDAKEAYSSIARRVGALSIVHRNHFAEMEESRGIALRPLMTELAAELRAGAPAPARGLFIDLELDPLHSTQDVAVSVAFLVTEIVEFAMLHRPEDSVEVSLRRTSDLTGRLMIGSPVLDLDEGSQPGKVQFERIVSGLAKQLRSPLDRKLGRYCVELPVFPA
jgi:two-component system, sensor histidine kinase PdtaS